MVKKIVVLQDLVAKRERASKDYDDILDWQRYMKDKSENIIILSIFSAEKVRTVLTAWIDLNYMVENTIKKAQDVCGRRWYVVDGIMETLYFPTLDFIGNSCLPRLVIK